ncbi:MAG: Trm112 family protein [Acidobacteriota bacterium]|nr:Trm112 family protein [Acidobacteriota bacterium]
MALDQELLDILVCPKTKGELEVVTLPDACCKELVEKYREHFQDDEPVVAEGLYCSESQLVYPIVSDIPIMLIDEALPAGAVLEDAE